jgi:hypothetical protein
MCLEIYRDDKEFSTNRRRLLRCTQADDNNKTSVTPNVASQGTSTHTDAMAPPYGETRNLMAQTDLTERTTTEEDQSTNSAQRLAKLLNSVNPSDTSLTASFTMSHEMMTEAQELVAQVVEDYRRRSAGDGVLQRLDTISWQVESLLNRSRQMPSPQGATAPYTDSEEEKRPQPTYMRREAASGTGSRPATPALGPAQHPPQLSLTPDKMRLRPRPTQSPQQLPVSVQDETIGGHSERMLTPTTTSVSAQAAPSAPTQDIAPSTPPHPSPRSPPDPQTQIQQHAQLSSIAKAPRAEWRRPQPHHPQPRSTRSTSATPSSPRATRVIVRFMGEPPDACSRLSPQSMRDRINGELASTGIKVSGVQFTRAGNIAVTPMAPWSVTDLLPFATVIGSCVAHGQQMQTVVIETDDPWPSAVVRSVQIPQNRDIWEVEQALCEELGEWNPVLRMGVKEVRVMCKPEDVRAKKRASVRIAFSAWEGCEQALQQGICAFGEKLRADRYIHSMAGMGR